jgi:hypothetical protein
MILIYGESGVGKSTSIFSTAPPPICYLDTENRNPITSLNACGRSDVEVDLFDYGSWQEIMEFYSNVDYFKRYSTIAVDSITHLMNIQLSGELEDEAFVARDEEEQLVKPLISSVKLSMEGYGAISTQMVRFMKKMAILRKAGHTVILTALLDQNPRWDKALTAGPALKGREFPALLPGFCDMIGLIKHRLDKDDRITYPPLVYFESPRQDFMAKYTGIRPRGTSAMAGPLDFVSILKLAKNENKGGKVDV